MKTFNTAGPIVREDHFYVDPLKRWDMAEIMELIDNQKYFLLYAPRKWKIILLVTFFLFR